MLHAHKNFFFLFFLIVISFEIKSEQDPFIFIDSNAQKMANVLTNESGLFETDRLIYEDKIKEIFEPMIDFRRVAASVMGKKYYLMASKEQRADFVLIFKDSLLDTYAETLAQWGDSTISTEFPQKKIDANIKNIEVKQTLDTGNSLYPISYKLKKTKDGWKIVNIIINGVNLGLTFRNQFQALAVSHNGNIELTLKNWVSDAGDAGIS
tara:strand:- start:1104 stop:1730 length:627 start_codon:yes stop_codon:yes gene_type:complete